MKVRVLAIVPSEAIADIFNEIKTKFPDLELDIRVANLANALPLVKNECKNCDVIVARGETAILIKKTVSTPVVEIPISGFDMLSSITQAEQLKMPFAVMGYDAMTRNAKRIKDILNLDIEIFSISQISDIESTLHTIKSKGYNIVVCGMGTANSLVHALGLTPINVMTSHATVEESLKRALSLGKIIVEGNDKTRFFMHLTECSGKKYIVYSRDCIQVFNTFNGDSDTAVQICEKLLPNITNERQYIKKTCNGTLYDIDQSIVKINEQEYVVFAFDTKKLIPAPKKEEIKIYSKEAVYSSFFTHFPQFLDSSVKTLGINLAFVSKTNLPVFILGESGTGKEQIAALIYTNSQYNNRPFYVIDAENITEKSWNSILYNEDSLFLQSGLTIYIKNIDKLNQTKLNQLNSTIFDSKTETRIKLIFSSDTIPGAKTNQNILDFINSINAFTILTKPIRQRPKEELLTLITLYINVLDEKYGKNVIGMNKDAEEMLLSYQWPDNLKQLMRVITDIVINADTTYIQASQVEKTLEAEKTKLTSSIALSSVIDISKKMSDIEKDIARAVLLKSNGNQSQAARRLGISRTTMWRLLS